MIKHNYKGFGNCPSICGVDYYLGKNLWEGKKVILLTELEDNHGTSITNAIEKIAQELVEDYHKTVVVEHYTYEGASYDEVEFESAFVRPRWKFLSPQDFFSNVQIETN